MQAPTLTRRTVAVEHIRVHTARPFAEVANPGIDGVARELDEKMAALVNP